MLLVIGFFVFTFFVLLVAVSFFTTGPGVVAIAIVLAVGTTWVSYWKSDAVALRMSRAKPASVEDYPRYHNLVEGLCIASGLPKPRLYVIDDIAPNAFATGRNPKNSAIAVTTGLLEKMNRIELEGVLAHELSHIQNYDILISTIAVTMVGILTLVADLTFRTMWLSGHRRQGSSQGPGAGAIVAILGMVMLILAPLIGRIMQATVGRRREQLADFSAVEMTRYPPGLIGALEKLQEDTTIVQSGSRATAHLWIEEPMAQHAKDGNLSRVNRMFATHPPLEERIAALREL
jgi:heat shock protein HtpX